MRDAEFIFEKLTDDQRASIVAVGIERAGSYQASVEAWLPHTDIVYDRFHLVANVNQAVDEVRRSLCRQANKTEGKLLEGKRFLVLANQEKLDAGGATKLKELLAANEPLAKAYMLKEQFRALFDYRRQGWAQRALAPTGAAWRRLAVWHHSSGWHAVSWSKAQGSAASSNTA